MTITLTVDDTRPWAHLSHLLPTSAGRDGGDGGGDRDGGDRDTGGGDRGGDGDRGGGDRDSGNR